MPVRCGPSRAGPRPLPHRATAGGRDPGARVAGDGAFTPASRHRHRLVSGVVQHPRQASGDAVAVVGLGCVFPAAADVATFWSNVVSGVDAITEVPPTRIDEVFFATAAVDGSPAPLDRFTVRRGGFVDAVASFDASRFGVMPVAAEAAEPDQLLALTTAAAALADVTGDPPSVVGAATGAPVLDEVDRRRVGVVLGRGGYLTPGISRLDQQVRMANQLVASLRTLAPGLDDGVLNDVRLAFQEQLGPPRPEGMIGLVPNLAASRIANRLDLAGPAYTVDAACASSLVALDQGMGELRSRRCDLVLVGGVHHCHDVTIWSVFSQLGALSASGSIRPFSRHADGILIGEGTGILVLERLADAERLGHRVHAVVRGSGVASDGRGTSLMSPQVAGQVLALERAYTDGGIDPASVGLVEAHGTATTVGDGTELETLTRVYAGRTGPPIVVGSVKSMIGHAMPAAGAAGLIKAVLAVRDGVLPPTLHASDEPHPGVAGAGARLVGTAEDWAEPDGVRRAGVNAFGFGGINAHVVVEQPPGSASPARPRRRPGATPRHDAASTGHVHGAEPAEPAEPMVLLGGASTADLLGQLDDLERRHPGGARLPATVGEVPDGPVRLAIVAPNARRLKLARSVLERGRAWRGRNDLWFEPEGLVAAGGQVALVYPGVEPTFAPRIDDVVGHFHTPELPDPPGASDIERQGRGIVAMGRILTDVLGQLGITADVMAGHSIGEWTAMVTSELIPPDEVAAEIERLQPGRIEVPDVVYVALGCGAGVAGEVVDGIDDALVTHDNCPHQSVICGTRDAIDQVAPRIAERKLIAQELGFRSGFHSPLFEPYLAPLLAHLPDVPFQDPVVPMWSATTAAPYPTTRAEIAALATAHLLQPVRFRQLVGNLHASGVRLFIQAGTGSLTGFIDDTLGNLGGDGEVAHVAISANVPTRSGMAQLRRVAAAAWVQGVGVDFAPLEPTGHPDTAITPATATTPGDAGQATPVHLGAPLVTLPAGLRLPGTAGAVAGGDLGVSPESPDPLERAVAALLHEAGEAGRMVLEARRGGATAPGAGPGTAQATAPGAGAATTGAGHPGPRTTTVPLSLATHPWLADHSFFRQAEDWPSDADRFPLVPMTGMVELMRDAATASVPGTVAVEVRDVRAMRWLAVEPPVDAEVVVTPVAEDTVKVAITGHARCVVRLAHQWPTAPAPSAPALHQVRPSPLTARQMYDQRWMFHGPRFQGVEAITAFGDDGIDGDLVMLAAPGAFLDLTGQLFGFWIQVEATENFFALPVHIERIEFFGPYPPPGTPVAARVRITSFGEREVTADHELCVGDRVLVRITAWTDRRFDSDDTIQQAVRWPESSTLSERLTPGVVVVEEGWPDSATRELMARRYLSETERHDYETRNPRAQRHLLLGRMAAKDGVRHHLWDGGHPPMFPAELTIANDDSGAPTVAGPHTGGLRVSVAHTEAAGAAAVATGPVGVDIESVTSRDASFGATVLSNDERRVLAGLLDADPDAWMTRAWAAKEAAAKAAGTGLAGRPGDFAITRVEPGGASGQWWLEVAGRWVQVLDHHGRRPGPEGTPRHYVVAHTGTATAEQGPPGGAVGG